jgi:hypothetical protein
MFVWKSLPKGQQKVWRNDMTEGQRDAPDRPEAERYYAQHASLDAGEAGSSEAALQEAINEGARQSWKLVGVTQDPTSGGVILVWDTSGFFSG